MKSANVRVGLRVYFQGENRNCKVSLGNNCKRDREGFSPGKLGFLDRKTKQNKKTQKSKRKIWVTNYIKLFRFFPHQGEKKS